MSPNTREGGEALSDIRKNGCERDYLHVTNKKKFSPESRVKYTNHITSDLVVGGHAREEGIIGESDGKHGKYLLKDYCKTIKRKNERDQCPSLRFGLRPPDDIII